MSTDPDAAELAQQLGVDMVTEELVKRLESDGYERRLDPGAQVLRQGIEVWRQQTRADGWELVGVLLERGSDPPLAVPPTTDNIHIVSKRASNTMPPGALGGSLLAAFPVPLASGVSPRPRSRPEGR
jgi:hypothetical protein